METSRFKDILFLGLGIALGLALAGCSSTCGSCSSKQKTTCEYCATQSAGKSCSEKQSCCKHGSKESCPHCSGNKCQMSDGAKQGCSKESSCMRTGAESKCKHCSGKSVCKKCQAKKDKLEISQNNRSGKNIASFQDCIAAGFPMLKTYPGKCITDSGKVFIDNSSESEMLAQGILGRQDGICKNTCGDGQCAEMVCMAEGCPCAESVESCPQDCKK